ncbi:hypothetical protein FQR65_LT00417 [Abscondita terminalis]|nr:hypothetical protein FQR65_LT00417 [Abscondita terminalis]
MESHIQDAVECIETHASNEVNVVILPPEPDTLTNEEQCDDDNIIDNQMPNDVPDSVEVDFGGDTESGTSSYSEIWDESYEESFDDNEHCYNLPQKKTAVTYNTFINPVGNWDAIFLDDKSHLDDIAATGERIVITLNGGLHRIQNLGDLRYLYLQKLLWKQILT